MLKHEDRVCMVESFLIMNLEERLQDQNLSNFVANELYNLKTIPELDISTVIENFNEYFNLRPELLLDLHD